ncbi:GDSL esterase/lipase At5g45920 [Nicotiana sylvestris]|uniref:GDSL esterase/lipase At5g45920 n=2 Tax=Nicotiana TaxID=4085 RepID=A0A1S3XKK5_TOBAC|nr:PREDICTED: GDSL esterase/lipase At5g45920 [Nicotiana sylvestris]XP_009783082.1 PREDICTED: GDSL esterase/lipase At5g45920 [Nicotiana sylvestris]XP_016440202.1 PREDICTED: GDSL esterase/lipase At5g45920-like [Nicotiana tabacum]
MRPKIYLFGDSITEMSFEDGGWGASLVNHFNRTVDVVLRGYSGYNTRWALKVIEKVFDEETAPLAVTVFFGANDACLPDRCSAFQHVPVDEYKLNLHSIVSFLKGRWPTTQIVLISPPPIDEPTRLLYPFIENKLGLPERTNEVAGNYAKASLAVAAECGVLAVDLWTRMQQLPGWQTACLSDGLHLSKTGNEIVFEEVVEALKKKGLSVETLPVDLPVINEIDPNDPLKSFEGI